MSAIPLSPLPSSQAVLESAAIVDGEIEVAFTGSTLRGRFSPFWLRDHCHLPESLHPETLQRQVDTFSIPVDIAAERVALEAGGTALRIVWRHDQSTSLLPAAFLRQIALTEGRERAPRRDLWDHASMQGQFPTVPFTEVMETDAGLLRWLELVDTHGFAMASNAPATVEATKAIAQRVGYIRETIFGGFWDFSANLAFKDTAYTPVAIGPHTDGTYSIDSPGYQMFHCLQHDGTGGENTLVDGFKVADTIRRTDPAAYAALTSTKVPAHYLGDGVHLRAEHEIIALDADGEPRQVAYNNYDRAPFRLANGRMTEFYRALKLWDRLVNDPAYEVAFKLTPGSVLLFDNWRTLHGRRAYTGFRRLCGAYLNKEDFDSRLRVLRGKVK